VTEGAQSQAVTHRVGTERERLEHLDMLRGLAALAVCMGHVRSFVFVDYSTNPDRQLWEIPFYVMTGLGSQAVIVFFALSGFLVGGPALRRIHQRRWNFPDYAVHRFTRLWTALIPALAMTAALDWFGWRWLGLAGYSGEYHALIASGPLPGQSIDLGLATFLGNVAFLMTVFAPIFGSDGPLWSLAYEFAYYFTIPLAWLAIRGGAAWIWRILGGAAFLAMVFLYPFDVPLLGIAWLAGALGYLARERVAALSPGRFRLLAAAALVALLATFPLTLRFGNYGNLAFGIAWALALPCLARLRNPGGAYGRTSFWLSEISFTLYVVHYPLVFLLWLALLAPAQHPVGLTGLGLWLGLLAASLSYALAMWWLFERNTGKVRAAAQRFFRTTKG
jgi:peptidoglycan/LPS O-acetylase OafA/YrhL